MCFGFVQLNVLYVLVTRAGRRDASTTDSQTESELFQSKFAHALLNLQTL